MTQAVIISIVTAIIVGIGLSIWTLNAGNKKSEEIAFLEAEVRAEKVQAMRNDGVTPAAFHDLNMARSNSMAAAVMAGSIVTSSGVPVSRGMQAVVGSAGMFGAYKPNLSELVRNRPTAQPADKPVREDS